MKIIFNPNKEEAQEALRAVLENDGFCPCKLIKNMDTKCMCLAFREQEEGLCHCGLYLKIKD